MDNQIPTRIHRKHPVMTREYAVCTPPIYEMAETLGNWLDDQHSGYIYGSSRWGKTWGVRFHLKDLLEQRFGKKVPLVIWSRAGEAATESAFWEALLRAGHHAHADDRITATKKRVLFLELLIARARACRGNYCILIIDEAQGMQNKEWSWLMGVQNELDLEGYRLTVISIGSHQMGYTHELLQRTDSEHIAARFFVHHARFHGLRSKAELKYALLGYDEDSEWPVGSGTTYLGHFAPEDFSEGRRLHQHADVLWQVLCESLPERYTGAHDFPMQHIARAVEIVLKQMAAGTEWDEAVSPPSWRSALARNKYSDHMRLVSGLAKFA